MAFEKVASVSDLVEDMPFKVEVGSTPVTLVLCDGEVHAVHDTCSHQEYSLSEGIVFDCQIECALHGSMFDLVTGDPESLPATTAVPVYTVQVDGDAVLVDVDQQRNDAPTPQH